MEELSHLCNPETGEWGGPKGPEVRISQGLGHGCGRHLHPWHACNAHFAVVCYQHTWCVCVRARARVCVCVCVLRPYCCVLIVASLLLRPYCCVLIVAQSCAALVGLRRGSLTRCPPCFVQPWLPCCMDMCAANSIRRLGKQRAVHRLLAPSSSRAQYSSQDRRHGWHGQRR